jgi:hypothetical protein
MIDEEMIKKVFLIKRCKYVGPKSKWFKGDILYEIDTITWKDYIKSNVRFKNVARAVSIPKFLECFILYTEEQEFHDKLLKEIENG